MEILYGLFAAGAIIVVWARLRGPGSEVSEDSMMYWTYRSKQGTNRLQQ